jgi:putative tributyrin esterase
MGGFGAIKIGLSHPDLFPFVAGLSPAIDVPRRQFSVRRIQQSWALRSIFGPWGSETRRRNDPFLIARSVALATAPYVFVSCGADESLLPATRDFAALLAAQHLPYEFHVVPGGHEWTQWNQVLPAMFKSLLQRIAHQN